MIAEDYVSYEVTELLFSKGFDEVCDHYIDCHWQEDGVLQHTPCKSSELMFGYACPTHQMAMKWLRKMHNVHIVIEYYEVDEEGFYGWIVKTGGERYHCHQAFSKDYEEAVEAALKYSLENLI